MAKINHIQSSELRTMKEEEGLILQGCGGDPQEWLEGINDLFTKEGILQDGSVFKKVFVFKHEGLTNLLFKFAEDMKMDIGKMAIWRLRSHETFGGTWLSDYVPNRLGGFDGDEGEDPVSALEKDDWGMEL